MYPATSASQQIVRAVVESIARLRVSDLLDADRDVIGYALRDPESAEVLESALANVAETEPNLMQSLRDYVLREMTRQPIGDELDRTFAPREVTETA